MLIRIFDRLSIRVKLWLIMLVAFLGMMVVTLFGFHIYKATLISEKVDKVQATVRIVTELLQYYETEVKSGHLTQAAATAQAKRMIEKMSYEKEGYFWIIDTQGNAISHPYVQELVGKNVVSLQSADGKKIVQGFLDAFQQDSSASKGKLLTYQWKNPQDSTPREKMSYGAKFQPWNWIVISGFYVDQIEQSFWDNAIPMGVTIILTMLILIVTGIFLFKNIVSAIDLILHHLNRIADGQYDEEIIIPSSKTELCSVLQALKKTQEELKQYIHALEESLKQNEIMKITLDNVTTCVMISDAEHKIIYLNQAATKMWSDNEAIIREQMPHFSAANLLGSSIDDNHKNPQYQRELLNKLTGVYRSELRLGELYMRFSAIPIFDYEQKRIGTAIEWFNDTKQHMIQQEIDSAVGAALTGDFSRKVNITQIEGVNHSIGEGINRLLDNTGRVVQAIAQMMENIAEGDLRHRIEHAFEGVFQQIVDDVNKTTDRLSNLIANIKDSANLIRFASSEISSGNVSLSERTEKSGYSIIQTGQNILNLKNVLEKNASSAKEANIMVSQTSEVAHQGENVMKQVIETMHYIRESSNKIEEIIHVIDGIAFQTNILALNAAVEAARAGEQGKGFAVVASEVRSLAQRSASASKEIRTLIMNSVSRIEQGADLVEKAGLTMNDIMRSVTDVTKIMDEINQTSHAQMDDIVAVNHAIHDIDHVTQQNTALVEEVAAASETLQEQALQLVREVENFKL